jgi:hypothetical protein
MWNAIVVAEVVFTSTMCVAILALPFLTRIKKSSPEEAKAE